MEFQGRFVAGKPEIKPLYFMGKPMVYIMCFFGNHLPGKPWVSPHVSGKSHGFPGEIFLDKNQQPDDVINEDGGFTNQF